MAANSPFWIICSHCFIICHNDPYFPCPGPSGNQPFFTRCFCSNNSPMLQKEEKAVTPNMVDAIRFSTMIDKTQNTMPATRNTHQHLVPN